MSCEGLEWAARDEQPILPTSSNPCITRAAGTQGVNIVHTLIEYHDLMHLNFKSNHVIQKRPRAHALVVDVKGNMHCTKQKLLTLKFTVLKVNCIY